MGEEKIEFIGRIDIKPGRNETERISRTQNAVKRLRQNPGSAPFHILKIFRYGF